MTLLISYRPQARAELDDAVVWYEQQQPGLGARFAAAVRDRLDVIAGDPLRYALVFRDIRQADVVGFPSYSVLYIAEPNRVLVHSVFHASRNPRIWKRRRNAP